MKTLDDHDLEMIILAYQAWLVMLFPDRHTPGCLSGYQFLAESFIRAFNRVYSETGPGDVVAARELWLSEADKCKQLIDIANRERSKGCLQ